MKTSLSHLPSFKQTEILEIVGIIRSVVPAEKVILFGSYARGNWVEDEYFEDRVRYHYASDYDFLVVVNRAEEKEYLLQDKIINRCRGRYKTEVNVLIHDLGYVNEGLSIGQYFFTDIIREGILLYDSGDIEFAEPRILSASEQKAIAQRYFDQWFQRGSEFLDGAVFHASKGQHNLAAFNLHQATENFYNTVLLVFTMYKPKTHSLEKLRHYFKEHSPELYAVIPASSSKEEMHLFDLLKRGYIDARYKNDYLVSTAELEELLSRVKTLQAIVSDICSKKIASIAE